MTRGRSLGGVLGAAGVILTGTVLSFSLAPGRTWAGPVSLSALYFTGHVALMAAVLLLARYRRLPFFLHWLSALAAGMAVSFIKAPAVQERTPFFMAASLVFLATALACGVRQSLDRRLFLRILPLGYLAALGLGLLLAPEAAGGAGEEELYAAGVIEKIDPFYREIAGAEEEIKAYLAERTTGGRKKEEQEALIEELNAQIRNIKRDQEVLAEVQEENRRFREELVLLKQRLEEEQEEKEDRFIPEEATAEVTSLAEAVDARSPGVRDFAVKIASVHPGSYYKGSAGSAVPGEAGLKQVAALHRYVSSQWKYVNDPLTGRGDYLSPASRTIALGLSGDCDDFAILLAACVEAIGGRARIVSGSCSEGYHAWCEVYAGDAAQTRQAADYLSRNHARSAVGYLVSGGKEGWIPLDWKLGEYSCGNYPAELYRTRG
jgi:hypothetical protein